MKRVLPDPTEDQEAAQLATWLRARRVHFTHIKSEGHGDAIRGARAKRIGVNAGWPDYVISSIPSGGWPSHMQHQPPRQVYLELKRQRGGRTSDSQRQVRAELEADGCLVFEAAGCYAAVQWLKRVGY